MKNQNTFYKAGLGLLLVASLSACLHDDDDDTTTSVDASYKVVVSNITNGQPLTPAAIVMHKAGYMAWTFGEAATSGLEKLAESGDTTDFISEAGVNINVTSSKVGDDAFGPGTTSTVGITSTYSSDLKMTFASMLANTNDAFTGLSAVSIGDLEVGDSMTFYSHVFDAGTEADTESAGTIAGPVDGSSPATRGYNVERSDVKDYVSVHAGVVTSDDGFTTSILNESHRWNGPAAKIVITRM